MTRLRFPVLPALLHVLISLAYFDSTITCALWAGWCCMFMACAALCCCGCCCCWGWDCSCDCCDWWLWCWCWSCWCCWRAYSSCCRRNWDREYTAGCCMWEGGPRAPYTGGHSPGCSITSNEKKKKEKCDGGGYLRTKTHAYTYTHSTSLFFGLIRIDSRHDSLEYISKQRTVVFSIFIIICLPHNYFKTLKPLWII